MTIETAQAIPLRLRHDEFDAVRSGAKQFLLHNGPEKPRKGDRFELIDADTNEALDVGITYVTSAGNPCALSPDGLTAGYSICSIALDAVPDREISRPEEQPTPHGFPDREIHGHQANRSA